MMIFVKIFILLFYFSFFATLAYFPIFAALFLFITVFVFFLFSFSWFSCSVYFMDYYREHKANTCRIFLGFPQQMLFISMPFLYILKDFPLCFLWQYSLIDSLLASFLIAHLEQERRLGNWYSCCLLPVCFGTIMVFPCSSKSQQTVSWSTAYGLKRADLFLIQTQREACICRYF